MNGHVNMGLVTEVSKIVSRSDVVLCSDALRISLLWYALTRSPRLDSFIFTWVVARQNLTAYSDLEFEFEFYVTTDGHPASLSWYETPIWGLRLDLYYSYDNYVFFSCGAPSLTRGRVWHLYMLLALASAIFFWSEPLGSRDHILLSHIWDFPFRRFLRLAEWPWKLKIIYIHTYILVYTWICCNLIRWSWFYGIFMSLLHNNYHLLYYNIITVLNATIIQLESFKTFLKL
jgi:hypothetical protein